MKKPVHPDLVTVFLMLELTKKDVVTVRSLVEGVLEGVPMHRIRESVKHMLAKKRIKTRGKGMDCELVLDPDHKDNKRMVSCLADLNAIIESQKAAV